MTGNGTRFALAFAAIAAIGCSHGPKAVDPLAGSASDQADVYRFVQTYMEAANHADLDTIMSMVVHRPDVMSVANGEITAGWDAIREQVMQTNEVPSDLRVALTGAPRQYWLARDSVLVVAPYTLTATKDDRTITLQAVTTLVLVKDGGSWMVVHEHNSGNCQKIQDVKSGASQ